MICVFTDASEEFQSEVEIKTHEKHKDSDLAIKKHKTMAFLRGKFAGARKLSHLQERGIRHSTDV